MCCMYGIRVIFSVIDNVEHRMEKHYPAVLVGVPWSKVQRSAGQPAPAPDNEADDSESSHPGLSDIDE